MGIHLVYTSTEIAIAIAMILTKWGHIPLQVFPATYRQYCNLKTIFYQVNYNCSGIPPYFLATCLKYSKFIGGIHLQLDRKWF